MERTAQRYRRASRWAEGFARGKISADPAYATVLSLLPEQGLLADVGCGEGYLLALVRDVRPALTLFGVDHDERRLGLARTALANEPRLELSAGDLLECPLPEADVIACLDVLHYLPVKKQDHAITRLCAALRPGGALLIRDAESGAGFRSLLTRWSERLTVAVGRHRGEGVYLRPSEELQAVLTSQHLQVEGHPCREGTPFANVLFVARHPATQ